MLTIAITGVLNATDGMFRKYVLNKKVTILFDGVGIDGKNGLVVPGGVRRWDAPSNRFQESQ